MALKAKSSDTDESSNDEDSKMKSYITRKFKKFIKNVNAKDFNKDRKRSSSSQSKSQDKRKKDARDGGQYTVPLRPKCFRCQGFGECPTYLKTIRKSKAFAATEGIIEDVDEEEELVESKFEKMNEQDDIHTAYAKLYKVSKKHEKLYKLTTKKLSDVQLEREEISTKFDEANQTIGALRFKNNFLAEKPRSLR